MTSLQDALEQRLDSFDADERAEAFQALVEKAAAGEISLPSKGQWFNLHCHSFYSFNGYGYSPSGLAWRGRTHGLNAMALVDFDVLDGIDEFLAACGVLGLRTGAGLETRVFVPEFADQEINSPGEPGVAYQIGLGFTASQPRDHVLLDHLKDIAQKRTQTVIQRVNPLLTEIALDYERDVLPLTPTNNPTERHVCAAYDDKARTVFTDATDLARYWAAKLHLEKDAVAEALKQPPVFQGILRAKTMKSGGVGYIRARGDDFPRLDEVNRFTLDNGAIPTFAFLDGLSEGEQRMPELLDIMQGTGVAAVNIIPDRNWNISDPETRALKVAKLGEFIALACERQLPILVGTEMNAFGQPFVDGFDSPELQPFFDVFREGMFLLHGHTVLQAHAGMGYLSAWAATRFDSLAAKNRFFVETGKRAEMEAPRLLETIVDTASPESVLEALSRST